MTILCHVCATNEEIFKSVTRRYVIDSSGDGLTSNTAMSKSSRRQAPCRKKTDTLLSDMRELEDQRQQQHHNHNPESSTKHNTHRAVATLHENDDIIIAQQVSGDVLQPSRGAIVFCVCLMRVANHSFVTDQLFFPLFFLVAS